MAGSPPESAADIARACKHLAALGFVASTDGNVSVKVGGKKCLITASGSAFAKMRASQVLTVLLDDPFRRGRRRPSSEAALHVALYTRDDTIRAIVHAHPPYATAFAVSGTRLTPNLFPEVVLDLGEIPLVRYAMPSSDTLGSLVAQHTGTSHAALLANHGAVTWGKTLEQAVHRMEKLEHAAMIEVYARSLGGVRTLTDEQVTELRTHHPLSQWRNE